MQRILLTLGCLFGLLIFSNITLAKEETISSSESTQSNQTSETTLTAESSSATKDKKSPPGDSTTTQTLATSTATTSSADNDYPHVSTEKIDVDPVTGTATISVPIAVPQGRGGIQPSVSLLYNSGGSNGILGMGWFLELGNIQRSTKRGIPKFDNTDTFLLVQAGSQRELADISGNATKFRPTIEGDFMKMEFVSGSYWMVTDKKGTKYYFGQTGLTRQSDPNNSNRILKWCLDRVEDVLGNYLTISFVKDQNQIYPERINYTGNTTGGLQPFASVDFTLEPRPDTTFSYKNGFRIETNKRISKISAFVGTNLQTRYNLNYSQSTQTQRSLLTSVVQYGSDGVTSLPATTFTYQNGPKGFQLASGWSIPSNARFSELQCCGRSADLGARIADVNSDGYPDILRYHEYLGGNPLIRETFLHDKNKSWVSSAQWRLPDAVKPFQNTASEIDREWGVRLADVNADGWIDVMRYYQRDYYWGGQVFNEAYISNKSNGWVYNPNWLMPGDPVPIVLERGQPVYAFSDFTGTVFDDVNGDGYPDYIRSKEGDYPSHWSYLSNAASGGTGWTRNTTWDTAATSNTNLAAGANLVDLNGDNLPEIMYLKSGTVAIYINDGNHWVLDSSSPWRNTLGYGDLSNGSTQFADINGDGLADLAVNDGNDRVTLYNTGNGWQYDAGWSWPAGNFKNLGTRLLDANSDGITDFLIHYNGQNPQLYLNNGTIPDLLATVNNGVGGMTGVEYDSATHFSNTFLPYPIPVVKSTTINDSLGHTYKTQYSYSNGLWEVDDREFRGFGLVRITDPDGNYAETTFLQDDIFKGRIKEQNAYDAAGKLFSKTVNTWSSQTVNPKVNFVFLTQADNYIYDGNASGRRTQQQFYYGEATQLGNLTKVVQMGEVNLATGGDAGTDTRTIETVYSNNTSGSNWLVGFPQTTTVKDNSGAIVRQTWFYYDGASSETTLPVKGLLSQKKDWGGSATGAVHPITKYSYDAYGNLLTTTDPKNNVSTVTYDPNFLMFPLKVKNPLNHEVNNEYYGINGVLLDSGDGYRGLWGQLKSSTDPNNQKGRRTYDVLGRVKAVVSVLDSITYPTSTIDYEYSSQFVKVTTKARKVSGQPATIDSFQFYDGLGRLIQTKARAEASSQYAVGGQTEYNSRGLPEKQYLSFFSSSPAALIDPIDPNRLFTLTSYDAMGRPVRITNPDGTYSSVIYDDWTTTSIDENGHQQKSYADAYGRLITKEEYLGADGRSPYYPASAFTLYAATQYNYDFEGNLLKITDAAGNITTIAYDNLGRKTQMQDPDMGLWKYIYDANGNLISQTDAKIKKIDFTYDVLNRLVNKKDSLALNVNYTYDDALITNSKGRLTKAQYSTSGQSQFNYDQVGRENRSVKTIDSINYTVERNYDDLSRLTSIKYPDSKQVYYAYNAAGQIEVVSDAPVTLPEPIEWDATYDAFNSLLPDDAAQSDRWTRISSGPTPPFAQFKLNDNMTTTNVVDNGSGLNNGQATVNTSVLSQTGKINRAFRLNGIDQYVNLNSLLADIAGDSVGSFAMWIYPNNSGYLASFAGPGGYVEVDWDPTCNCVIFGISGQSTPLVCAAPNGSVPAGAYSYVAFVQDGVSLKIYVNGVEQTLLYWYQANKGAWFSFISAGGLINGRLGSYNNTTDPNNNQGFLNGNFDDVRYYKYALSADEVKTLYNGGSGTEVQHPIAFVENDGSATDGLRLTLDSGASMISQLSFVHNTGGDDWVNKVSNSTGHSVEARLKVGVSGSTAAGAIKLSDGAWNSLLKFKDDQIFIPAGFLAEGAKNYIMDTKSAYHLYRIVSKGNSLKIFVDDQLRISGTLNSATTVKTLEWGDNSIVNTEGGQIYWDSIRYSTQGAFDPYVPSSGSETKYVSNVDYNHAGQITKIQFGNGTTTTYSYDPQMLRLINLKTVNALNQTIQNLSYTYDSLGNIKAITDGVNTATQSFQYDALNRLTQAVGSNGTKSYAYDKIGNITMKDGLTYTYGQNGAGKHAVTSLSDGTTFNYDLNGNMIKKTKGRDVTDYIYDAENRLTEVKKGNKSQVKFEYDGDGGRTKKISYVSGTTTASTGMAFEPLLSGAQGATATTNSAVTTKFIGSLYEEDGSRTTDYIFLGGTRVASITNPAAGGTGGQMMYYHGDHLGSTNVLTDNTGAVKELMEYEPWGSFSRHDTYGTDGARFYFNSKLLDGEAGLYFYGARYYNPVLGRFITPDSLVPGPSNPQAFNRYSYVLNNPINRIDPTGNWSWSKFWNSFAGGFLGGAVTVLTGGLGAPLGVAMFWGGAAGGALTGGLEGGWQGMLIGAASGGVLGGGVGLGIGKFGAGFGIGALLGGAGAASATDNWDSFAGGFSGGIIGSQTGNGIDSYYHDGISVQNPDEGIRAGTDLGNNENWANLGIGTTDGKALAFANENQMTTFYTRSRGLLADFVRAGMQKVSGHSLASRQYAHYMKMFANNKFVYTHSEGTLTMAGAIKSLNVDNIRFDNLMIRWAGPVISRSTAEALSNSIGAQFKYGLNFGDPIGVFTTVDPIKIGVYGSLGVATITKFHGTDYYVK